MSVTSTWFWPPRQVRAVSIWSENIISPAASKPLPDQGAKAELAAPKPLPDQGAKAELAAPKPLPDQRAKAELAAPQPLPDQGAKAGARIADAGAPRAWPASGTRSTR